MIVREPYYSFLALLRAGLWGEKPSFGNQLAPHEWERIYRLACMQTVEGIVYDGVMRLPAECLPPAPLLIKWTARVDILERRNSEMNGTVEELDELFAANGLQPCLMKGQGLAACYANPLHRVCGDTDWYFTRADYQKANRLIAGMGVRVKRDTSSSSSYLWKGVQVEHHSRFIDLHNPFIQRNLGCLQTEEEELAGALRLQRRVVKLPSPLLMHVQVNTHILKHMLAFGIGLRQLCDSARVCYAYHDICESKLEEVYGRAGILRWMQALHGLLITHLGLPPEYLPLSLPASPDSDRMLEEVLRTGNFGFYDKRWCKAGGKPWVKRERVWQQVAYRFWFNMPYAPMEAFWFPVMQTCSRIRKMIIR